MIAAMRFIADGPDLPHDLLVARDEGQVIFFCGAGVSRARAGLADFFGLANAVVSSLGVGSESPARKLLALAQAQEPIAGVGGLLAADRVFALLEREFDVADIRKAVAEALKPAEHVDLAAHRIMLDLATGPNGAVRLVTTNFDLLFEACDPDERVHAPPYLPDPRRPNDIAGVTHLHGRVTDDYSGAHNDAFVLSSADFGRAYLAEGWATRFIRGLLDQYQLVFVGYTADDPPVQYLLEALNDHRTPPRGLYAFQPGDPDEAKALWRAKGVEAIPFDPANGFSALWRTLEAWAERARDPEAWQDRVLKAAGEGPAAMAGFERGQVAHIVSTAQGARRFSQVAPPAEWLAVFDPAIRYARSAADWSFSPFDRYGLDNDPPPQPEGKSVTGGGAVPINAWDGLAISRHDRADLADHEIGALRGPGALRSSRLVPRLAFLGDWIAKVADQPLSAWWAVGQGGLHPDVESAVIDQLNRCEGEPTSSEAAWRQLARSGGGSEVGLFNLAREAKRGGWTAAMARDYAAALTPRIVASRARGGPLVVAQAASPGDIVSLSIDYPSPRPGARPSDVVLPVVLAGLRQALGLALAYRDEIGKRGLGLPAIRPDDGDGDDGFGRTYELAALFFHYQDLLERLRASDLDAARVELAAWRGDDEVAIRLRIWAAGETDLQDPQAAAATLLAIDQDEFWDGYHQRDLMLSIKARWAEFSREDRSALEQRLLAGRSPWRHEEAEEAKTGAAWSSIQRLQWLVDEGCELTLDWAGEKARLMLLAPDWQDASTAHAAASMEGKSGWVETKPEADEILGLAPGKVLQAAHDITAQRDFTSFVVRRPLEGLARQRPVTFLRALVLAGRASQFPAHDWETFLDREAREHDRARLANQIAHRLARLAIDDLGLILLTAARWFEQAVKAQGRFTPGLQALFTAMIRVMTERPETGRSAILGEDRDWLLYAVNAPSGAMVDALMSRTDRELEPGPGFATAWRSALDETLALPGDTGRYAAVVLLRYNLAYFNYMDSDWTHRRLLSLKDSASADDRAAFWTGFLASGRTPSAELYRELAPAMLEMAGSRTVNDDYAANLASMLLAGWGTRPTNGARYITHDQMRHALLTAGDRFRSHIIWCLERWWSGPSQEERDRVIELLEAAWPRQQAVRTARTTDRLVGLALSAQKDFPRMVAAVTPHLGRLSADASTLYALLADETSLAIAHPEEVLSLLYAALDTAARAWPYGAEQVVTRLAQQAEISLDPRLLELRRRLVAR
jgi:hypothetical protein